MSVESVLVLQPGREKPLLRRHPWIFSGAVQAVEGQPEMGATVKVVSSDGEFLARAAFSPSSQIRARVWSWSSDEIIDTAFFRRHLTKAVSRRQTLIDVGDTDALRLVYAESDGLPGLIVDRYAETLVVQFLSCGVELWREAIIENLREITGLERIYERSDVDVRELEGLEPRKGWLSGTADARLEIREYDLRFQVDLESGHKTGFYLDQRDNRLRVRDYAGGREVLDCFSYTGGFTLNSMVAGAKSVVVVEESQEALYLLRENVALNRFPDAQVEYHQADVFKALRTFRDRGRQFDLIVLDPPKFAPTKAQVDRAARGYKDINLLAFKLLRPGGILVTFSCSGGLDSALFQKIVADAALDARVQAQILERLSQAGDHPVALNFPEGEYLKGLVCLVD